MYKIYADSCCDLTYNNAVKLNISLIPLKYSVEDTEYLDEGKDTAAIIELYNQMRAGKNTRTSQPSPEAIENLFEEAAKNGEEIIYITVSSGISGTYNASIVSLNNCLEKYPNAKIAVIDSLCASGGYGLFLHKAAEQRDKGMSFEEIVAWADEYRHNVIHWFTVDDLEYLKRGGRVSKTAAAIGGVLKLKPVLHVNENGQLVSVGMARGRKNALKDLVKNAIEDVNAYSKAGCTQTIHINHADCIEDAEYCRSLLLERTDVKDISITLIGPTIGSHSGPGTLAIFCMGNVREKTKM